MEKSLLFKLFRMGALPAEIRSSLELEGIAALEEGIGAALSASRLKGPRRRYFHKKTRFPACIAVTKKRVAVFAFRNREIVNIPAEKLTPDNFRIDVLDSSVLLMSFESSAFIRDWSGVVEIKFRTRNARTLYEAIMAISGESLRTKTPS